ncbi:hypothetical protein [Gillisia hiemivivida]|jgi:hypothetical protein|uniref:Uncharacterized protein n=1 Tax=Gillisia hiemivivida TaxID=291190 RepID=A0A5C6ZTX3_9FLAO|nr:hypothetical protein [Gillisia hiemivivida]TXD94309.1 hypothetical protein ES724_06585 [Gillisia hiemivivida]
MAEIEIEKKSPIWPWILLAILIIAALLYFFVLADDDVDDADDMNTEQVMDDDEMDNETMEYEDAENMQYVTAINEYDTYINNPEMGVDHEYTNGALMKLISAVDATANNLGVDIDADLENARNEAQEITEDPMKVTHANSIKDAGQHILKALQTMQEEKFSNLSSAYSEVDAAFAKIEGGQETLNQKEEVKSFFTKVSSLLNSMK